MAVETGQQTAGRRLRVGILLCLIPTLNSWSGENGREFSDLQGRTFNGQVVTFDAAAKSVTIRRSDDKTAKMPLAVFSEADRQYIRDWGVTNGFMHQLKISAILQSSQVPPEESGADKAMEDLGYTIILDNPSGSDFGKITVEYCVFYRQGERDGSTINYDEGILHGKSVVDPLKNSSSATVATKPIRLYYQNGNQTMFGRMSASEASVRGIWLRLKMVRPSGGEVVREFRTSDDEFWKWSAYSIGVGLNKGDSSMTLILLDP